MTSDQQREAPRSIRWAGGLSLICIGAFLYNWLRFGEPLVWLFTFGGLWVVGQLLIFYVFYRGEPCPSCGLPRRACNCNIADLRSPNQPTNREELTSKELGTTILEAISPVPPELTKDLDEQLERHLTMSGLF